MALIYFDARLILILHQDEGWRSRPTAFRSTAVSLMGMWPNRANIADTPALLEGGHHRQNRYSPVLSARSYKPPKPVDRRCGDGGGEHHSEGDRCRSRARLCSTRGIAIRSSGAEGLRRHSPRLLEIRRRNELRQAGQLPLLSITKELRRMKQKEELEAFRRFEAVHGRSVWAQVLEARRQAEGNRTGGRIGPRASAVKTK